jgi:iron complex transport system substrate-binding protein
VTLAAIPQRLVSLAPNLTEILFALDLGKQTVGVDAFSDYPADVKSIAKVSGPDGKFNFEQIVALKPDLVFAAGGIASPEDIKKLDDLKVPLLVVGSATTTFDSVSSDISLVGSVTGHADQAKKVTDAMKQKLDSIKTKIAGTTTKPRVYWELDATDATKPFTVGPGNFINDIITLAGGVNVFANAKSPFAQVSVEQIIAANPEVIILSDAAYGVTVDSVLKRAGWSVISAVKKSQVFPIDDNLVSRPGPRVVDGLEAAAKLIHPEAFK